MTRALLTLTVLAVAACGGHGGGTPDGGTDAGPSPVADAGAQAHTSSIAVSADGATLFVVNPDSDSVSILSVSSRALTHEVLLSGAHPVADPDGGAYTPSIAPRALALSADGATLFVTGERSGSVYVIDVASAAVTHTVPVGSEPFGLVVSESGDAVFVACSQDEIVVRIDTKTFAVTGSVAVTGKPWALALVGSPAQLAVTHFLSGAVSVIDLSAFSSATTWTIPDTALRNMEPRLAHGQVRTLYDVAARPGADEVWVAHAMLGTETAQPMLDFERTAFPTLSVLHGDGEFQYSLSTDAQDVPGIDGAFTDVVSGPRAFVFTRDGHYAFVVDTNSEDVLVVDATRRVEASLLRPLPGHLPEGLVLSPDETHLYVEERNTNDVVVVDVKRTALGVQLTVDGDPITRLASDPMPASLRLGQHLFFSANSDEHPITKNHWIACATCHPEGRSDAVTWRFEEGPRDTPTNAGGTLGTGFLFRTADRDAVQDYWHTINVEQGGNFDPTDPSEAALLDALADYVNHGIPPAVPPATDATKVALGREVFNRPAVKCATCHAGPRLTDSGSGNPTLALERSRGADARCRSRRGARRRHLRGRRRLPRCRAPRRRRRPARRVPVRHALAEQHLGLSAVPA